MKVFFLCTVLFFLISHGLSAQVIMEKTADGILLLEKGEKVLFYQTEPRHYEGQYERRHYIHPLWGLDGAVLTEDFPADHLHHRGIFWAWHQVWIGDQRIGDPWAIKSFEQRITDVEFKSLPSGKGVIRTEVEWLSDQWVKQGVQVPYLSEQTTITIFPGMKNYRRIDFKISLLALEENLMIGGSEDAKGYSGFSVRMVLPGDVHFLGPDGEVEPQVTAVTSPGYVNVTGSMGVDEKRAGIVMVDHPGNPGHPQPWILRKKQSMQNAAYPGSKAILVSTTDPLVLEYSLLVYTGRMNAKQINKAMKY